MALIHKKKGLISNYMVRIVVCFSAFSPSLSGPNPGPRSCGPATIGPIDAGIVGLPGGSFTRVKRV